MLVKRLNPLYLVGFFLLLQDYLAEPTIIGWPLLAAIVIGVLALNILAIATDIKNPIVRNKVKLWVMAMTPITIITVLTVYLYLTLS